MELETFVRIGRRWWPVLVVSLLLGALLGRLYADSRTPLYEARTELLVGPLHADQPTLRAAGQAAQTYAVIGSGDAMIGQVTSRVASASSAEPDVTALADEVTRIMTITVRHPDAAATVAIAQGIAADLETLSAEETSALEARLARGEGGELEDPILPSAGEIRVVETADLPDSPVSPDKALTAVLGAIAGLVSGALAVTTIEFSTRPIRVVEEIARTVPDPVVGVIAGGLQIRSGLRISTLSSTHSPRALSVRGLAVDLVSIIPATERPASLLVTGTDADDHSREFAANLAGALAMSRRAVALIDAEGSAELARALRSSCSPEFFDGRLKGPGADWMTWIGAHEDAPAGTLGVYGVSLASAPTSDEIEAALRALGKLYSHVVIHAGPAFGSMETVQWARASDASLLVATTEATTARTLEQCVVTLRRTASSFIGIVFDEKGPRSLRRLLSIPASIRRRSRQGIADNEWAREVLGLDRPVAGSLDEEAGAGDRQPPQVTPGGEPVEASTARE